jgi:hypothetical protein
MARGLRFYDFRTAMAAHCQSKAEAIESPHAAAGTASNRDAFLSMARSLARVYSLPAW